MENLKLQNNLAGIEDIIAGALKCSTSLVFSRTSKQGANVGLSNPSNVASVKYALYHDKTGTLLASGTLGKGDSLGIPIQATTEMSSYRLQNQSTCGSTGTTPYLNYSIVIEG